MVVLTREARLRRLHLQPAQGASAAAALADVEGFLADDDPRLRRLGGILRRPIVLGSYAMPFPGSPSGENPPGAQR